MGQKLNHEAEQTLLELTKAPPGCVFAIAIVVWVCLQWIAPYLLDVGEIDPKDTDPWRVIDYVRNFFAQLLRVVAPIVGLLLLICTLIAFFRHKKNS